MRPRFLYVGCVPNQSLPIWPEREPPWVMGILNVTPDSFSDGGKFFATEDALVHALRLIDEGADILDVGAESTRPGSSPVPPELQIERLTPVIARIRTLWQGPISIDTQSAEVAESALKSGATWVNDISALRGDPRMRHIVRTYNCPIVLMHMRGVPASMQQDPVYGDVVAEVREFLLQQAASLTAAGFPADGIILDPGIGFGKTTEHSMALLRNLAQLAAAGFKILVGASRKSFIGHLSGAAPADRLPGSVAAALWSVQNGATIIRVHDVAATRQALSVWQGIGAQLPL